LGRLRQSLEANYAKTCASMKTDFDMLAKQMVANETKLKVELEHFNKKTETAWGNMEANIMQRATELKSLENRTDRCEEIVVDNTTKKE